MEGWEGKVAVVAMVDQRTRGVEREEQGCGRLHTQRTPSKGYEVQDHLARKLSTSASKQMTEKQNSTKERRRSTLHLHAEAHITRCGVEGVARNLTSRHEAAYPQYAETGNKLAAGQCGGQHASSQQHC
jgi:hypothetical protein